MNDNRINGTGNPHLTGGVYCSLLNEVQQKIKKRHNQVYLIWDINRVVNRSKAVTLPGSEEIKGYPSNVSKEYTSLKTVASDYIHCKYEHKESDLIDIQKEGVRDTMIQEMGFKRNNNGGYEPVTSSVSARKNCYQGILYRMDEYIVKRYLVVDRCLGMTLEYSKNMPTEKWLLLNLAGSLIYLIQNDGSIQDDDKFYVLGYTKDGCGCLTKKELVTGIAGQCFDLKLQPFLLGVLFYIVSKNPDNSEGADTVGEHGWLADHKNEIAEISKNITITLTIVPCPKPPSSQEQDIKNPSGSASDTSRKTECPKHSHSQSYFSDIVRTHGGATVSAFSDYSLVEECPVVGSCFMGRTEELGKIETAFSERRHVFLYGDGAIGKSELARKYAQIYKERHQDAKVIFAVYTDNLQRTICDKILISGLDRHKEDTQEEYYRLKLSVLKKISDDRTLIIIDNFDADWDPELPSFLAGPYKVLFTSRNSHQRYCEIQIGVLGDADDLFLVFKKYYESSPGKRKLKDEDVPAVKALIQRFQCHTYMVELLAKQMAASHDSAEALLARYQDYRKLQEQNEEIFAGTDTLSLKSTYEHICEVFHVSDLSKDEKQILLEMSVLDIHHIDADLFKEWAQPLNINSLNSLIRKGWIRDEYCVYSMNPMIQAVVHAQLLPNVKNCRAYLEQIGKWLYEAWGRSDERNQQATENILSLARYFSPFKEGDPRVWSRIPDFLWQVNKFEQAINYGKILFETNINRFRFRKNSMHTGYCARIVGECLLNWGKEKEARKWFKQAAESMEAALGLTGCSEEILKAKEADDHPARGHELLESKGCDDLARCYKLLEEKGNDDLAWCYERLSQECKEDPDRALRYAGMALRIRKNLEKRILDGETDITCYVQRWKPYAIDNARTGIALVYQQIACILVQKGQLCEEQGQHKEAYEKYKEALKKADLAVETMEKVPVGCVAPATRIHVKYRQGVCHYYLGMYLCNHGNCPSAPASAAKEFELACDLLEECLSVQGGDLGLFSRTVLNTKNYLADTYAALGLSKQAKTNYKEIIEALQTHYPNDEQQLNEVTLKLNGLAAE